VATSLAHQRLSASERREAILQTAIRLFAQNGFRGTTTRELAQAVGVSEPVLYQHFPSKSDLYKAIIETLMERVEEMPWDGLGLPLDQYLSGLAASILDFHDKNSNYIRILLYSGLEGHELSRIFHERHACKVFEALSKGIQRRMEDGSVRADLDPTLTARAFVMMISDVGLKQVVMPGEQSAGERQRLVDQMVNIFLHGIQSPDGI
jgi:AcrR family transcriptional regulator